MQKRWMRSLEQRRPRKRLRQQLLWSLQRRRRVLDPQHRMRVLGCPQKLEGRMTCWLQRNPMLWRRHSRKLLLIQKLMLIWNLLIIQKLLQFKLLTRRRQLKRLLKSPKVSSVDTFGKFNANICGNQPADSCVKPHHTLPWRHQRNCAVCPSTHWPFWPVLSSAARDELCCLEKRFCD